jgi:hypothetical protein
VFYVFYLIKQFKAASRDHLEGGEMDEKRKNGDIKLSQEYY